MFKWIGIFFLVLGCGLTGTEIYRCMKKSLAITQDFLQSLTRMKEELRFSKAYLDSVFQKCMLNSNAVFFEHVLSKMRDNIPLETAWCDGLEQLVWIDDTVKGHLLPLGKELGTTDLEAQTNLLQHTAVLLDECRAAQAENLKKKGALYPKIGFVLGALAAILLF